MEYQSYRENSGITKLQRKKWNIKASEKKVEYQSFREKSGISKLQRKKWNIKA